MKVVTMCVPCEVMRCCFNFHEQVCDMLLILAKEAFHDYNVNSRYIIIHCQVRVTHLEIAFGCEQLMAEKFKKQGCQRTEILIGSFGVHPFDPPEIIAQAITFI